MPAQPRTPSISELQAGDSTDSGPPRQNAAHKRSELKVFISSRESSCTECGDELGRRAWIHLAGDRGALCLTCADLDHLVFLASGDAALTRRARKHSQLSVVVLKWSRARKRYERQGLLVQEEALEQAEHECLADAELRNRRREREEQRRAEVDMEYVAGFASRTRELFPAMPRGREHAIARHACAKYSGRVGRSRAAKEFDPEAVELAVQAHVRHAETAYDRLLGRGLDRIEARHQVAQDIRRVLEQWSRNGT